MEELFDLLMFASYACRQKSLVDSSDTICIQVRPPDLLLLFWSISPMKWP